MRELLHNVQNSEPQIRLVNLVAFVFIGVLIIPGMDSMRVIQDDTYD